MDFYKIKNNTSNPLVINGNYLDSYAETIISDYFFEKIDDKYFLSEVLINFGKVNVEQPIYMDPPKNITTVIKERNLEKSIRDTLLRANEVYEKIKEKVSYDELNSLIDKVSLKEKNKDEIKTHWKKHVYSFNDLPDDKSGVNSNGDIRLVISTGEIYYWESDTNRWKRAFSTPTKQIVQEKINDGEVSILSSDEEIIVKNISSVVREINLEEQIRDALEKARQSYSILESKIGYNELKPSIQSILDSISDISVNTHWKDPVLSETLLPNYEDDDNSNGDVRLVLDSNSLYRWSSGEKVWKKIFNNNSQDNNSGGSPISIVKENIILDEFFAYEGQQLFNLRGKYVVGSNDLQVILNGILLTKDTDYIEVDEKIVQILFPLKFEDYLVFTTSGKESVPYIVVEKHIVEQTKNIVFLNHSVGDNPSVIQVFLNGISVSFGENNDYIISNNKSIFFNYNLVVGDIVIVRFDHSSLANNVENQIAQMNRVYMSLAKQMQYLREVVESK